MRKTFLAIGLAAAAALGLAGQSGTAAAAPAVEIPHENWSFDGVFGTYDRGALQRGFQVYKEVCAACHGMKLVAYRDLADLGYNEDQIKAVAAGYMVEDGPNDEGEMYERPGLPSDRFHSPFPNDNAARAANGGAMPPDMSLMAKQHENGPDYIHAILVGYTDPPADAEVVEGKAYNKYFPGHWIGMPQPLAEGSVTYQDGTPATVEQMSRDVATFLMWAAEPKMEIRKQTGVKVVIFLLVMTGVLYAVKRRVWASAH